MASSVPKIGSMHEIFVECDVAKSPYSSDQWLEWAEAGIKRGAIVEEFEVARLNVREKDMKR